MGLIQLHGEQASKYREWLQMYREKMDKEPGPTERTEAFFCARSRDPWSRPSWV